MRKRVLIFDKQMALAALNRPLGWNKEASISKMPVAVV